MMDESKKSSRFRTRLPDRFSIAGGLAIAFALTLLSGNVVAGGPENAVVVVNGDSQTSMLIANHYVHLRGIPSSHVIYLFDVPDKEKTNEKIFKTKILEPILSQLTERGLEEDIDYIIYSSGFPTLINIPDTYGRLVALAERGGKKVDAGFSRLYKTQASITSMTWFARQVMNDDPAFMLLDANRYMSRKGSPGSWSPSQTFRSRDYRASDGSTTSDTATGQSYFISAMLGVTRGEGMSEQECLDYLKRAVSADDHPPAGSFFFCDTADVRTKTRKPFFADAISELEKMGLKTRVINNKLPQNTVVAGLVFGAAKFDWAETRSEISPGAICENLTSIGATFDNNVQTKCTENLKFGAAGSSGTVVEPFAIPARFPHPMIHVHYVRGCTLGEAFYQSIHCPYQMLIVGDPLCRPWAKGKHPGFEIAGLQSGQTCSGTMSASMGFDGSAEGSTQDLVVETWMDGKLVSSQAKSPEWTIDTTMFADGFHELRIIASTTGPIEFSTDKVLTIKIDNHGHRLSIKTDRTSYDLDDTVRVEFESSDGSGVELYHHSLLVGEATGRLGVVEVPASKLGRGPVRLTAKSVTDQTSSDAVTSEPLNLVVEGRILTTVQQ